MMITGRMSRLSDAVDDGGDTCEIRDVHFHEARDAILGCVFLEVDGRRDPDGNGEESGQTYEPEAPCDGGLDPRLLGKARREALEELPVDPAVAGLHDVEQQDPQQDHTGPGHGPAEHPESLVDLLPSGQFCRTLRVHS
jgi:hypothetical protein